MLLDIVFERPEIVGGWEEAEFVQLLLTQRDFHGPMAVSSGSWHALQLACAAEHALRSPLAVGGERCNVRVQRLLVAGSALEPAAELRAPPGAKQNASPRLAT